MSPAPPPPKPKGLGGFSLPWRGDDDAKGKSKAKAKPPLIGKFKGLQAGLLDKLKDQATAAITGGVSGVLVLLTIYKVISSRESVLAESRKEEQRGIMERKARLAVMCRSLAGSARPAGRRLNVRLQEIRWDAVRRWARAAQLLRRALPGGPGRVHQHHAVPAVPLPVLGREQSPIDDSDGELAMDDAWQVAVGGWRGRGGGRRASSDPLVDATARERLYDVIDAAVARESATGGSGRGQGEAREGDSPRARDPKVITRPSFKATARALSSTAGTLAGSPGAVSSTAATGSRCRDLAHGAAARPMDR